MTRKLFPILLLALALPAAANAAPPFDLVVSGLEKVEPARRQARFDFVVREMALTIASPPGFAVAALGTFEAELAFENRVTFLHTRPNAGESTSAWDDLSESGEAESVAFLPGVMLRKGLPYSFEIGGRMAWHTGSRQFVVGGFGRWVPFGNWSKVPDVSVGVGYDGMIGNDQLELGVFHVDVAVGYTFKMNLRGTRPGTKFSPFAGYSFLQSHARPGVSVAEVSAVTGWTENAAPGVDPRAFRYHRGFLGMEVRGGGFAFRFAFDAGFPRKAPIVAGLNVTVGLRF